MQHSPARSYAGLFVSGVTTRTKALRNRTLSRDDYLMKNKQFFLPLLAFIVLSGCTSPAQRMANCEAQGISKDTCYLSEQNRQQSINNAAEAAALNNAAQAVRSQSVPTQHAQSAKRQKTSCDDLKLFQSKEIEMTPQQYDELAACNRALSSKSGTGKVWKGYGVKVERKVDGSIYVDDHAALRTEQNEKADVYQSGLYNVIIYKNGTVILMQQSKQIGRLH